MFQQQGAVDEVDKDKKQQKDVKTMDGFRYIEADLFDYEIAYRIGIDVIKNTLDQILVCKKNQ